VREIEEVEVGETKTVFVAEAKLMNLRRLVNVELAKQGMKHKDAAARAKVPVTGWSRLMNAQQLSARDVAKIAKGIGMKTSKLYEACSE